MLSLSSWRHLTSRYRRVIVSSSERNAFYNQHVHCRVTKVKFYRWSKSGSERGDESNITEVPLSSKYSLYSLDKHFLLRLGSCDIPNRVCMSDVFLKQYLFLETLNNMWERGGRLSLTIVWQLLEIVQHPHVLRFLLLFRNFFKLNMWYMISININKMDITWLSA